MTNASTGKRAEDYAAAYLSRLGYEIVVQNWRTRWCEIDIIAKKNHILIMVEVKYRRHTDQGHGLDYITAAKLRQMKRAAEWYVADADWDGPYQLAAIEMVGEDYRLVNFIDNLT